MSGKQHDTEVFEGDEPVRDGLPVRRFVGWCKDCGWRGETRTARSLAEDDATDHVVAVTAMGVEETAVLARQALDWLDEKLVDDPDWQEARRG